MTAAALSWGCALLAFAPFLSLLFVVCYHKAQLVIVVTTSAFAFLLSSLGASLIWFLFDLVGLGDHALLILLPGILAQFVGRCAFTRIYHTVEKVIEISIQRHEQHTDEFQETMKLRLELNDWACGLAAGTGFGGMHAVLLYGTLLASESNNLGVLYQPSCPGMPSLVVSALNTFLFSILDVVWMLLTFYGLRQRELNLPEDSSTYHHRRWGALLQRSKKGGTTALKVVLLSHAAASFTTTANGWDSGCVVSLPVLTCITIGTVAAFWGGVSKVYLPINQRERSAAGENRETHAFHGE